MKKMKVKGFTLIELMVVVAIIAILAAIAIPMIFQYRVSANRAKCVANMKQIQNMVESRRAASTTGKLEADVAWDGEGIVADSTGYFKSTPKCPQNGTATYVLTGSKSDTWLPSCGDAAMTVEPYNHVFPK